MPVPRRRRRAVLAGGEQFPQRLAVQGRLEADSLPTSRDAVACPNFSDPANLSRSSQCSAIKAVLARRVNNGPASGNVEAASAFGVIR